MRKEIIGNCTLYLGDSLEIMPTLAPESIDLVITDPPYGDNVTYGRYNKTILNNESVAINYLALLQISKLLKDNGTAYYFTNWKWEHKLRYFIDSTQIFNIEMLIGIVKNNIAHGNAFRSQSEYCLVLDKGAGVYNLKNFSNMLRMEHINHDSESHPHEKGLAMLEKIILHSSKTKDDLILDCFMGSGSMGVAAAKAGRKFVGIEIDPKWFDIACRRIEAAVKAPSLF